MTDTQTEETTLYKATVTLTPAWVDDLEAPMTGAFVVYNIEGLDIDQVNVAMDQTQTSVPFIWVGKNVFAASQVRSIQFEEQYDVVDVDGD